MTRQPPGKPATDDRKHRNQSNLWKSEKAQTTIDLMLAVVIFFGVVAFLTVSNPFLFFPGGLTATDHTTTADRLTIELKSQVLTNNGTTSLTHDEVVTFFSGTDATIEQDVSIDSEFDLHVRLTHFGDSVDEPPAFDDVGHGTDANGNPILERGPTPGTAPTVATRNATLGTETVQIKVTVWQP